MIRSLVMGLFALAVSSGAFAAPAPQPPATMLKVKTDTGVVAGAVEGPARAFRAIPYAAPPVGPLRWRPPQPAATWKGDRDASADGPACEQTVSPDGRPNGGGYAGPVSEDCLTLNVFTPP